MRLLPAIALIWLLSACGPGPVSERVVVQNDPVAAPASPVELPPAVVETVGALTEIARNGSTWDMARLARATPGFRSNSGELDHADYWYLKYRTGDWPMEHVGRVLAYAPAVAELDGQLIYVWPYMANVAPNAITPKVRRDAEHILGAEGAQRFAAGAPWPGYRLGISADGVWRYFYTGSD